MKKIFLFLIANLVFIGVSFAQNEVINKPFKPKSNMTAINPLRGDATVKVGNMVYLSYTRHASVGIYSEITLSDDTVLKKVSEYCDYKNKQDEKMSGADEATITIVYKAEKEGVCEIQQKEMFRGETKQEFTTKVTVEN